tara:strand:+ start:2127 stop:2291 length:165 start_codon:yes stop_codon:yes gene_type:complete
LTLGRAIKPSRRLGLGNSSREPRDMPHIVELGPPREPAHVHIFDHVLAQGMSAH